MFSELLHELSEHAVTLVAVSKTHPAEKIWSLYQQGQRDFAENRPQEMLEKHGTLPEDVRWHFIGHLQTNKVRMIAPFVHLIHSVDSLKLLQTIDKEAARLGRVLDCLLQFHIAVEETKFGFEEEEARNMLSSPDFQALQHVRICGVMGMATFTDNTQQVEEEFRGLFRLFAALKHDFFPEKAYFKECSMGMSGDWRLAVQAGSTMVRIGSLLFGDR